MLDKDVFKDGMNVLLIAYPSWGLKYHDADTMQFWYEKFQHMTNERFEYMVAKHIEFERFNPTVKSLLENDTLPRKSATQIKHEQMLRENGLL